LRVDVGWGTEDLENTLEDNEFNEGKVVEVTTVVLFVTLVTEFD
jgi:hypothetical protein